MKRAKTDPLTGDRGRPPGRAPWVAAGRRSRRSSRARATVASVIAIALLAAAMPDERPILAAGATDGFRASSQTRLAPGVTHESGTILTSEGTQVVHVATADPADPSVRVDGRISNDRVKGRETVSHLAERSSHTGHWAVAAVNGDFWSRTSGAAGSSPLGLHVQSGEVIVAGTIARPTLGVDETGGIRLERANVQVSASLPDGQPLGIDRVNQARGTDETVLYTSRFAPRTGTDASGTEVILSVGDGVLLPTGEIAAVVSAVRVGAGDSGFGTREAVLSASGSDAARLATLRAGDIVALTSAVTPGWETVTSALGGDRFIVQDGAVRVSAVFGRSVGAAASFVHPRTAVGVTEAGHLLMATLDGRQPGYSVGATVYEMGELMRSLGAVTAINLDGGGSTTMAIRPPGSSSVRVANRPSDGTERAVTNELVVYSRDPFPPVVGPPVARLDRDRSLLADGRIPITVDWSATDASGIASMTLQRQVDGAPWETLDPMNPSDGSAETEIAPGRRYAFRVRAADVFGNRSQWAIGGALIGRLREQDHERATYSGDWRSAADADASGGSVATATASKSAVTFEFTGDGLAWIAPRAPDGGRAAVSVDGGPTTTVDLAADERGDRLVVYRRRLPPGPHTLRITVTSGPPDLVPVDAFVTLAPAD